MAYQLTPEMVRSITDLEVAWSTTRLLPKEGDIPEEFWKGNVYTRVASAIFYGKDVPQGSVEMNEGIEPEKFLRCVHAHLQSLEPKHEHKIAGVGFMIARACTVNAE